MTNDQVFDLTHQEIISLIGENFPWLKLSFAAIRSLPRYLGYKPQFDAATGVSAGHNRPSSGVTRSAMIMNTNKAEGHLRYIGVANGDTNDRVVGTRVSRVWAVSMTFTSVVVVKEGLGTTSGTSTCHSGII